MKAAWYEKQGSACDVLVFGELLDPVPAAGEVRGVLGQVANGKFS